MEITETIQQVDDLAELEIRTTQDLIDYIDIFKLAQIKTIKKLELMMEFYE